MKSGIVLNCGNYMMKDKGHLDQYQPFQELIQASISFLPLLKQCY